MKPATFRSQEDASTDAIFQGTVRKWNDAGTLVSITDRTDRDTTYQTASWYRPDTGAIADDIRRFAPGDRVLVRVRGDRIVKVTAALTMSVSTPADERKRAAASAQHIENMRQVQEARGQRVRKQRDEFVREMQSPASPDQENALARLRHVASTSTFVPVADMDVSKWEPEFARFKLRESTNASGVAFNMRLKSFTLSDAVASATARLGKAPNRYSIHRGTLYLSRE